MASNSIKGRAAISWAPVCCPRLEVVSCRCFFLRRLRCAACLARLPQIGKHLQRMSCSFHDCQHLVLRRERMERRDRADTNAPMIRDECCRYRTSPLKNWVSPFPKDQFSADASNTLIIMSSARTPGLLPRFSTIFLYIAFFVSALLPGAQNT